jgi:predicted nucleic acid-binding protein
MENRVFIDSSFFIAVVNADDPLHARAVEIMRSAHDKGAIFSPVTSNFVVNEVITVLSQRTGKALALAFADFIYHSSPMHIITIDRTIEAKAVEYLKNIASKNVSFCDCTILAILELFHIPFLATFDRDFQIRDASFEVLM